MEGTAKRFSTNERSGSFQLGVVGNEGVATDSVSTIQAGVRITGDIQCQGALVIAGEIEGTIIAAELTVLSGGVVHGPLQGTRISVSGTVQGEIVATESLHLKAGAKIHGDITTAQLSVERGAIITGQCSMPQG
jgi:cytoskeletal protein CcmA (bactofilin family)